MIKESVTNLRAITSDTFPNYNLSHSSTFFLILLLFISPSLSTPQEQSPHSPQQTFIIHASSSHKPSPFSTHHHLYSSLLHSLPPLDPPSHILYTYRATADSFSAHLTAPQAEALRRAPGVLSVVPDRTHLLHTTRTPHFLGLTESTGLWPNSDYADNIIIGVLDTGIWAERRSFSDSGLCPVPSVHQLLRMTFHGNVSPICMNKKFQQKACHELDNE
ncbi:subtilisin-like protease SBT1.4 [Syzygium oleosum]|uniref:subtilisin-like protease SBT1.4 n=1 Tax=Syzygium oleosum TaxID=219896 RepID=UPI0024BBE5DD|nr:subtilisin-like protease SBT1.4 [Syzygium oleosum]